MNKQKNNTLEKHYRTFSSLIKDQWSYGGKKYSPNSWSNKESTDKLFENYSHLWIFGTMDKYCYRYRNTSREKDLLKIGCYCYIIWLKRMFYISSKGSVNVKNLDAELKIAYHKPFIDQCHNVINIKCLNISHISDTILYTCRKGWVNITQDDVCYLFVLCFNLWKKDFSNTKKHDTDTDHKQKQQ